MGASASSISPVSCSGRVECGQRRSRLLEGAAGEPHDGPGRDADGEYRRETCFGPWTRDDGHESPPLSLMMDAAGWRKLRYHGRSNELAPGAPRAPPGRRSVRLRVSNHALAVFRRDTADQRNRAPRVVPVGGKPRRVGDTAVLRPGGRKARRTSCGSVSVRQPPRWQPTTRIARAVFRRCLQGVHSIQLVAFNSAGESPPSTPPLSVNLVATSTSSRTSGAGADDPPALERATLPTPGRATPRRHRNRRRRHPAGRDARDRTERRDRPRAGTRRVDPRGGARRPHSGLPGRHAPDGPRRDTRRDAHSARGTAGRSGRPSVRRQSLGLCGPYRGRTTGV